jgi:hypothetical protein
VPHPRPIRDHLSHQTFFQFPAFPLFRCPASVFPVGDFGLVPHGSRRCLYFLSTHTCSRIAILAPPTAPQAACPSSITAPKPSTAGSHSGHRIFLQSTQQVWKLRPPFGEFLLYESCAASATASAQPPLSPCCAAPPGLLSREYRVLCARIPVPRPGRITFFSPLPPCWSVVEQLVTTCITSIKPKCVDPYSYIFGLGPHLGQNSSFRSGVSHSHVLLDDFALSYYSTAFAFCLLPSAYVA